jgi:L,D-peptidoglycan transpeptidase YkuD (ErfK/YbiS/YcfS/YnhG family)
MARPAQRRFRRAVMSVSLLLGSILGLGPTAPAQATTLDSGAGARVAAVSRVTLDGVSVALPAGSSQVVTTNHTRGHRARLSLWQRGSSGWQLLARTKAGRTGYGGLVPARQRKQSTGTTPLGTFRLLSSFGTHAREAGFDLDHRTIHAGDFWVQDNRSAYYNRYRHKSEGGFRWWLPQSDRNSSERLTDFPVQYEYAVVTSFNYAAQVRHRGAGIFLHVNGSGATAGCVSAPRWFLLRTLATLDPALKPVIAIGR